jgi:hypothetical protein
LGVTEQKRKNNYQTNPPCEEKQRLTEELLAAYRVLSDLQADQVQAMIEHDPEFARFDDLIYLAREKKDQTKYALIAHIENHHC